MHRTNTRYGICVWAAWLPLAAGCAAGPAPLGQTGQQRAPAEAAPNDKAHLPLEQIDPPVSKPQTPTDAAPLSERSANQIAAARELMSQQRFTEAAIKLERALRYDPDHPEIHATLAWLHWQAGNIERSKSHAAEALQGNPDLAVVQFIIGRGHAMAGEFRAAVEAYRRALLCSDFGNNVEIAALCHFHLAEALKNEGYLTAALGQYEAFEGAAQRLDEMAEAQRKTGRAAARPSALMFRPAAREAKSNVLEQLGRYAEAAETLKPLVESAPADQGRAIRYARLLLKADRAEEALVAARAISSNDDEVFELLLAIYQKAGKPERVLDELRSRIAARPDDAQLVLRLAELLARLGRPGEARATLSDYLQAHPDARLLRERLIAVLVDAGAWHDAVKECAAGIAQRPDAAESYVARIEGILADPDAVEALLSQPPADDPIEFYLRGVIAKKAGRTSKAEDLLRKSFELDASFIPVRVALADLYLKRYDYAAALDVAKRPDERTPQHAPLERVLGRIYDRLDNADQAEAHLTAAIRLDRSDTESMLLLARLYERTRQINKAQQQLRVLLNLEPGNEEARELLALLYLAQRKPDIAFEQLDRLKRISNNPTTIARCEAVLDPQLRADSDARRAHLRKALQQGGPDAATWVAIARSYNEFQPEPARDAFLQALEIEPGNEVALLGLAETYQRLLQYDEAIETMRELLRRRPNRDPWRLSLIKLHAIVQNYDVALELARDREAAEQLDDATRFRYRLVIADLLRDDDRDGELLERLEAWAAEETDSSLEWTARLAAEYMRQERHAQAVEAFETVHKERPGDWQVLGRYLHALTESGAPDRATQFLLDRLELDPESDSGVWMAAALMADIDRVDDALELARNRLLLTANREAFQNFIIDRLRVARRFHESVDFIELLLQQVFELLQGIQQDRRPPSIRDVDPMELIHWPNDPTAPARLHNRLEQLQLQLGLALTGAKMFRDAEKRIQRWLDEARDPQARSRYLRVLAACLRQKGEEDRANEAMHRALLIEPEDPLLNNDVAYAWIDAGVRLEEAEPMIRYALWRLPQEAAYLDTYGWLKYKQGEFAEAKVWIERAKHNRNRDDPVMYDHLGDICWRLGQKNEALEYWQKAKETVDELAEQENAFNTADERRVRDIIEQKLEAARSGKTPPIADLAQPKEDAEE